MKRIFAMSDIHGQCDSMVTLLKSADFNPSIDQVVFVGDLIDRGPDSVGVIKFVKKLQEQNPENVFVIQGNHEIMMRQYIFGEKSHLWLRFGGLQVIEEMKTRFADLAERNEHLVWLANLPLFHLDHEYLYVHAGIDFSQAMDKQPEDCTFMSLEELYSVDSDVIKKSLENRTIVHGHTPNASVYRAGHFISCDTGASVLSDGKLSLVDLTNQTYYYHDPQSTSVIQLPIVVHDVEGRLKEFRLQSNE